jgi:hypothetical protein
MSMSPRLMRPRATGFSPASIAGIANWWDANDSSTLTYATGISEWRSKSGLKTTASQSTGNNQPVSTAVNGKSAILFDGVNDGFDFTGVSRTDETWIIACAQVSNQSSGIRMIISDASSGYGVGTLLSGANRFVQNAWGNFSTSYKLTQVSGNVALAASVLTVTRSASSGWSMYRNGSLIDTTSGSASTTIARIGYLSSASFQFNGWIGEIICYSAAIDSASRSRCEKYLGSKWGITVA